MTASCEANPVDVLTRSRLVAVLRAAHGRRLVEVGETLCETGMVAIEITLTTPGALTAIEALRKRLPSDAVVGAGSILTPADARRAHDAGATFLVSPILSQELATWSDESGTPLISAGGTATEVAAAHAFGSPLVKVFPASPLGPGWARDVLGPLPHLRLMPTGGVGIDQVSSWLRAGATAVGLGGALLGDALDEGGDLVALRRRATEAVRLANGTAP